MLSETYKRCGHCGKVWQRREDLIQDPEIVLVGFQATFDSAAEGLFLFNHTPANCRTTLALHVGDFADYATPCTLAARRAAVMVCPGHCLRVADLEVCETSCDMRWVRDVMQQLKRRSVPLALPQRMARVRRERRVG